jgi:uncharacterized protein (TIGR03382 family)
VQVNSGFRTVAQQYLLYRWYQLGRCGITAAATPGRSNHQSGRAVDLANYSGLITPMANKRWSHSVPGDPVHFDHTPSPDIRGRDVKAFQRLWNRNNPNDKIAEDGAYGPQTEARLKQAPATGFAVGASCTQAAQRTADILMIEGPDKLAPNARAKYALTVANLSGVDWPATTRLVVEGGQASPLYDAASWTSPTEVGTLASDIGAGGQGIVEINVVAPPVTEETAINTRLQLTDGSTTLGTLDLAVTVTPNGDENNSGDAGDNHDDDASEPADEQGASDISGGCSSTGGNAGWLALGLIALVLRRRRR